MTTKSSTPDVKPEKRTPTEALTGILDDGLTGILTGARTHLRGLRKRLAIRGDIVGAKKADASIADIDKALNRKK